MKNFTLAVNYESLELMLKFGGVCIILLLLVFVLAVITPKLAKVIDKIRPQGKNKISAEENQPPLSDDVQGVYDPQYSENKKVKDITTDGDENNGSR